jgi:hypothetical protein
MMRRTKRHRLVLLLPFRLVHALLSEKTSSQVLGELSISLLSHRVEPWSVKVSSFGVSLILRFLLTKLSTFFGEDFSSESGSVKGSIGSFNDLWWESGVRRRVLKLKNYTLTGGVREERPP